MTKRFFRAFQVRTTLLFGAGLVFLSSQGAKVFGQLDGLPPSDVQFMEDFSVALEGFRGMSLEEFREEFGPRKAYLESGGFVRGDANVDGRVDISDALCTLTYLFLGAGPCASPRCADALDADDDGRAAINDAIYLLSFLFRSGARPPAPFSVPGDDPTRDELDCFAGAAIGYDPMAAEFLDGILRTYPVHSDQQGTLTEKGFVVVKNYKFNTFFEAFVDVFAADLPVYISVDAMLDALHLSFDRILMEIEEEVLVFKLEQMLRKMNAGVNDLQDYSGGVDIETELDDVAFWIAMARSLLAGERVPGARPVDATVEEFLSHVESSRVRSVELFGQVRKEDFSQFVPRGHYTRSETLQRYFQAMMWVQRAGMNFVEFKRHAAVAYLLTRNLLDTGAAEEWKLIEQTIGVLVGTSDSLNPEGMATLVDEAGITSVADLLSDVGHEAFAGAAIASGAGRQLINSQLLWYNPIEPGGFTPIPPAFHVLGQRFIVDSFVFQNVVFDRVATRFMPSPFDAWFVLGNRATVPLLESELEIHDYHANLAALDWIVSRYPEGFWGANSYNLWLSALRTLQADTTSAEYPDVMRTETWDRRMLHAQLASWAHLRHDTLLYAKQSHTLVICEYPDAWVDPYPEFFENVGEYAELALQKFDLVGLLDLVGTDAPFSGSRIRAYFESLRSTSGLLQDIAQAELEELPLTDSQLAFLKDLVRVDGVCGMPLFDGWYPDLLYDYADSGNAIDGEGNAFTFDPTIADVHTDPNTPGRILHVGVGHPNLMVLTVNNGCGTKAYVGPVFSYYEHITSDMHRMTDEEWRAILEWRDFPRPRWTAEFVR